MKLSKVCFLSLLSKYFNPIFLAGGRAAAAICSVEEADKIVQVAVEKFGGVHVLVANAGILRDKSFQAMTEQEWDIVLAVHLRCVVPSQCWPYLLIVRCSGTYKVRRTTDQ